MIFAVTLTKNRRDGYIEDIASLKQLIRCLEDSKYNIGDIGLEVQEDPKQHGCLHMHFTMIGNATPYMKRYDGLIKGESINYKIKEIPPEQMYNWWNYCMKGRNRNWPLIYDETSSVGSKCIF